MKLSTAKCSFKLHALAFTIGFSFMCASPTIKAATIGSQLDSMFGSMSNATTHGDYKSVTRDGYTGGGFTLRSKLRTLTPVNIQLPSASGGCGGIDLFGGSFSFINAEEFVQMLRNIAANATGLAFQLALNAMDAVLDNAISKMQAVIQQMNDLTVNSCQLAKGLLVDTAAAFGANAKAAVSSQLSSDGISDQFEAMWGNLGGSTAPEVQKQDSGGRKPCDDYGNIMWCLLSNGTFSDQFTGSQDEQKELVMSLTGTIIISKDVSKDKDGSAIKAVVRLAGLDPTDVLESILNGDRYFRIWSCRGQTDTCMNPSQQTIQLSGLAANINNFFTDHGYLAAMSGGNPVSDAQLRQADYYNVSGATSKATQIARNDLASGQSYVRVIAPVLAYSAAYLYINDLLTAAATGARVMEQNDKSASVYYKEILMLIDEARKKLALSYNAAVTRYGSEGTINEQFQYYMQALPVKQYEPDQAPTTSM